jgi:hypothetical protein
VVIEWKGVGGNRRLSHVLDVVVVDQTEIGV